MSKLKIAYKWMNENRLVWALAILGLAIGTRFGFLVFNDPNHIYTLHDILFGYR